MDFVVRQYPYNHQETSMKKLFNFTRKAAAVVLGLACFAQAAHADALADIKARKKVLIAIDLGAPPFGMTNAKLEPQGSDVETARLLAKDMGVELEIVQVTGPNRIPFLMTGKADMVISSFSITPERQKVVAFTQPYGASQFVVAAPKGENIKGLNDLVGKRVAVVRGNMQDSLLTPLAPKGTNIVRFDDDATVTAAIISGQVDALCAQFAGLGHCQAEPVQEPGNQVRHQGHPLCHRPAQGRAGTGKVAQRMDHRQPQEWQAARHLPAMGRQPHA
jgi:polar amino acid transport system substrate-binding protein